MIDIQSHLSFHQYGGSGFKVAIEKERKKTKETYSAESLKAAVKDVEDGKYGPKKAGKVHRVPASTVYDHVSGRVQHMHSGSDLL